MFRTLSKDDQKRYVRFRNMEKAIKDNYAKLPYSSQGILDAHLKKLDGLLDAYLTCSSSRSATSASPSAPASATSSTPSTGCATRCRTTRRASAPSSSGA